jgi:hypothetical protein
MIPDPFSRLQRSSALPRTADGRIAIPTLEEFPADPACACLSDAELDALYHAIQRKRSRWRFWHYLRLGLLLALAVWTYFLMPIAATHRWPFN